MLAPPAATQSAHSSLTRLTPNRALHKSETAPVAFVLAFGAIVIFGIGTAEQQTYRLQYDRHS